MTNFTDGLWRDLAREYGPTLAQADRPEPGRAGGAVVLRRPHVLAGSTLGLAGLGTALLLALGGTAAPSPALAVTRQQDGSVLVHDNVHAQGPWLQGAEHKLAAMGIDEEIAVAYAPGPAAVAGPVTCTPWRGAKIKTPVKVLLGSDGTHVIPSGNTGAGSTVHLADCVVWNHSSNSGNSGNTGAG
jgi:hypothetical protein